VLKDALNRASHNNSMRHEGEVMISKGESLRFKNFARASKKCDADLTENRGQMT
jgi:hypothetical protein